MTAVAPTPPVTHNTDSPLKQGNSALRAGKPEQAIVHYLAALAATPALSNSIAANIAMARKKYRTQRNSAAKPRVAVCGWELSHNAAGRVYTLAMLYETFAEVEIIGSLFPKWGGQIWEPIRDTPIAKHSFVVEDEAKFIDQAIQLVAAHPYDIVHLSKPRAPNIFFGMLYKLIWDAKVLMDIDDEELAFVGAETPISVDDYLKQHGKLPDLKDLPGKDWTRLAVGLAKEFDGITVCNTPLQQRYGGEIIRHARDEKLFKPSPELKRQSREKYGIPQDKKVVLFFGTPREHKGLIETAQAIAELQRSDVLFCIVGDFPDPALKKKLQNIKECQFAFLPNQPFKAIPEVVSIADCCILFQDETSLAAKFQTPAKLSDALGMGLPVITNNSCLNEDILKSTLIFSGVNSFKKISEILNYEDKYISEIHNKSIALFRKEFSTLVCKIKLMSALKKCSTVSILTNATTLSKLLSASQIKDSLFFLSTNSVKKIVPERSLIKLEKNDTLNISKDLNVKPTIEPPNAVKNYSKQIYITNEEDLYNRVIAYNKQRKTRKAKVAVYTAISNNYDNLIIPDSIVNEWDYFIFTDSAPKGTHIYDVRVINVAFNDPTRFARYVKTHPHTLLKEYEYTVWVDSNILLRGMHLKYEVDRAINHNILLIANPHPDRKCLSEELAMCKKLNKDDILIMDCQVDKYFKDGMPKNYGMIESNLLIRNNKNIELIRFNNDWWDEITKFSRRDQLSIMYLLWKHNIVFSYLSNVKNFRDHADNDYCLFPHGGMSNRQTDGYEPPTFLNSTNWPLSIRKNSAEDIHLNTIQLYWKKKPAKNKIVIYTAIVNNYDILKIPMVLNPEWDYVCFTDRIEINGDHPWKIKHLDYYGLDQTRTARFVKTHPHYYFQEYELSVWIDANILIKGNGLSKYIDDFLNKKSDFAAIPHPHRNCTYDEAEECIKRQLDDKDVIVNQINRYREARFPTNFGLIETNLLIRLHNKSEVIELNNSWWKEIECNSKRDQISLMYVLWLKKLQWTEIVIKGKSFRNLSSFQRFQHGVISTEKEPKYSPPYFLSKSYSHDQRPYWLLKSKPLPVDWLKQYQNITTDVIICVHNALADVKLCLASVANSIGYGHRVILVDDGSDTETKEFLFKFSKIYDYVTLIRNEFAKGYTKAANIGLKFSKAKFLILLNSDTIVPKYWILKLLHAAYSRAYIGIVGPICNAASWQSVPLLRDPITKQMAINTLPAGKSVDEMDKYIENNGAFRSFPLVPLVNGVCYGIKREVLDSIGYLDEDLFPKGYGEEDDFSMRALNAGFMLSIATHCYIFHAKSKSFGSATRLVLAKEGGDKLRERHGALRITRATEVMRTNPQLLAIRACVCELFDIKPERAVINKLDLPRDSSSAKETDLKTNLITHNVPSNQPEQKISHIDEYYLSNIKLSQIKENLLFIKSVQPKWSGTPKSAMFILPNFRNPLAGGIRTILMTALDWFIHWRTSIVIVSLRTSNAESPCKVEEIANAFPKLNFKYFDVINDNDINSLPEVDVGICSSWPTSYVLAKYNRCKAKFYFMQDYESLFYPAGSISGLIDETYRFGFYGICNSQGIGNEFSKFGSRFYSFTPGIDHKIFKPAVCSAVKRRYQIVFYGRPNNERNAFFLGVEALRLVKMHFGDNVNIVSVGANNWKPKNFQLDGIIDNLGVLDSLEKVAELYRTSDIGLVFMLTPHPSYQPLEFMASGCVTVTNRNIGTSWLLKDKVNCVLTSLFPVDVAATIIDVLENNDLKEKIREEGLVTSGSLNWDMTFAGIREFVVNPTR